MDATHLHSERSCRLVQSWIGNSLNPANYGRKKRDGMFNGMFHGRYPYWTPIHFHISLLTSFPIKLSNFPVIKKDAAQKKASCLHWIIKSPGISGSLTEHTPHAKSNTLQTSHCTKIYCTPHMTKLLNKCPDLHKKSKTKKI